VLTWANGSATGTPCVPPFSDLVELTGAKSGCCTVDIGPSDVDGGASLQALLGGYAGQGPVTVCMDPGTYTLSEPLVLGSGFSDFTLQACGQGVIMQGPSDPGAAFTLGLIVIQGAGPVTIRGIELSVPLVGFSPPANSFEGLPQQNQELLQTFSAGLQVAIGISANDATGLTIADCTFNFDPGQANVFGAGIYATGTVDGIAVTGCTFQSANPPDTVPFYDLTAGNQAEPPYQLTFGYLQEVIFPPGDTSTVPVAAGQLEDAVIERCLFQGVTVAVFAMSQIGTIRIDQNTVRNCYGGFWLYSIDAPYYLALLDAVAIGDPTTFQRLGSNGNAALSDRVVPIATSIGTVLPATPPVSGDVVTGRILSPSATQMAAARQMLSTLFAPAAGPGGTPGTAAPAAAREAAQEAGPAETGGAEAERAEAQTAGAQTAGAQTAGAQTAGAQTAGAQTAGAQTAEAQTAEAQPAEAQPDLDTIANLPPAIGIIFQQGGSSGPPAIPVADTGTSVSLRLDLCDCQVDAVIAESYSGAALLLADLTLSGTASALVHGNRLRSRCPVAEAAMAIALAEASVTGNIVANEVAIASQPGPAFPAGNSLTLVSTSTPLGAAALAVVGNVFIDPPIIPGQSWELLNTTVNYSAVPTVTGISPTSGLLAGGETVTITGTGFTAATQVIFGPTTLTNQVNVSDTEITVASPAATTTGTVDIQVGTPAGYSTTSAADQFTYIEFILRGPLQAEASPAEEESTGHAPPTRPYPTLRPTTEPQDPSSPTS
jgi:IPT/TIG domain